MELKMNLPIIDLYKINIYERYYNLKKSEKETYDNYDLAKIFEYYTCIKLSEEYNKEFYEYNDIDSTFKEDNDMSQNDTGIDCSDMINTIVQCKLRKDNLGWSECGTFFGSRDIYDKEQQKVIVRWDNLILARNDCHMSNQLLMRKNNNLFIDKIYNKEELLKYCEDLLVNKPIYPIQTNNFVLRDYQVECIDLIEHSKNVVISLPTGTGKNIIITYYIQEGKKYLILVPRIILMDQLKKEILNHTIAWKQQVQLIGDLNNDYDQNKNITICTYNSVAIIEPYFDTFYKIFIDEAHHVYKPFIYMNDDNNEDENNDNNSYLKIIRNLSSYNNNIYLSATIDKISGFDYYFKDIRDMIDQNYLCDYNIHIPVFSTVSDKSVCEFLIKNYRNIIIYCNKRTEGIKINELLNKLQKGCSDYIDCGTTKKERNIILNQYKNGELTFLVNVKVLVEGFDAPITKGVCFMHLPKNKTTLIQIIGRALRKHPTKTIANVILPFSDDNDESNICNFLKILSNNDTRIYKSYSNKKLGGYISIDYNSDEQINNLSEFRYNKIYDSMGNLINNDWVKNLGECQEYITIHGIRPRNKDDNSYIRYLSAWLGAQLNKFKKNVLVDEKMTLFKQFYLTNHLIFNDKWFNKLNNIITYIDVNNKRPTKGSDDKKISAMGRFLEKNEKNYKEPNNNWDQNKKEKWEIFVQTYNYYLSLITINDIWIDNLNKIINYFNEYKCRPSEESKDNTISSLVNGLMSNFHTIIILTVSGQNSDYVYLKN